MDNMYATEFLNSQTFHGIPNQELKLKVIKEYGYTSIFNLRCE
jgi:hypothetical protein